MEIQYFITEEDYVKSVKLAAVLTRKQMIVYCVCGFGLLLLGVFGPDSLKILGYSGIIFGILWYVIALFLIFPTQAKRSYRDYDAMHKPLNIDLLEHGFTIKTENGQKDVKWENLLKWRENNNYLLVYFAPKMYYIVPKRISKSGFDIEGFRLMLKDKLGAPI